jgi:PAS domain S-box-containing protein
MPNRVAVSSADFIRNIGYWQGEAMRQPVAITHHGRERLVLAAPDLLREASPPETDHGHLNQLRAAHAALVENIEEAFITCDAHLRITQANAMAEAFIGAARDELLQHFVLEVLPAPLAAIVTERLQRVLKSRKPEMFECGVFDGRHATVRIFPTPDGAAVLFHNMTEQHVLRREREEMLALQTATSQHGQVALMTLDTHGRITSANATFCAWTGFSADDLVGHRLTDLSPIGARRDLSAIFERVMRESAPLQMQLTLLGKKGDEISGRVSIAPIQTDFVARGAQVLWTRLSSMEAALTET